MNQIKDMHQTFICILLTTSTILIFLPSKVVFEALQILDRYRLIILNIIENH
jgi:hypothetical protein